MSQEATDVHHAMKRAQWASEQKEMVTATFRLDSETKTKAEAICERNSTTLSGYLRQCCEVLVEEYHGSSRKL